MRKITAPASCEELQKQGISRNQEIYIDGDGVNHGALPIKAQCIFPEAKTIIGEEKFINITTCGENATCFKEDIIIEEEVLEQIDIVMEASNHCYQSWEFECISAPIKHPVS